jgi:hypothetical protein
MLLACFDFVFLISELRTRDCGLTTNNDNPGPGTVVHACNSRYSGGED